MIENNGNASTPEESAFESARAALDRAGEMEKPVAEDAPAPAPEPDAAPTPSETTDPPPPSDATEPPPSDDADATEPPPSDDNEPPSDADEASGEPEAVEEPPETAESVEEAEPEAVPPSTDEPPEVIETERMTMETREFTIDYPRGAAQVDEYEDAPFEDEIEPEEREPKERRPKPRPKVFKKLQEAFRRRPERRKPDEAYAQPAHEEVKPAAVSSRDEALRNRVMQMDDAETRDYLLNRVLPQMTWYSKKSGQYKTQYQRFVTINIFLGALIPVFALLTDYTLCKVFVALLGASVTGVNAYLALHNYHDLWLTYRTTREDLIHTLYCYFNRAGVFAQKDKSDAEMNVMLVDLCEEALSKETGRWTTIVQKTAAPANRDLA